MPVVSPEIKVQAVKRLGGLVQLVGETYTETQAYAQVGAPWSALRQRFLPNCSPPRNAFDTLLSMAQA